MIYIQSLTTNTTICAANLFTQSQLKMRSANQRHCDRYDILIISYLLFAKPNPCCGWWNLYGIAYLLMMHTFFGWLSTAAAQSKQRKKFKWLKMSELCFREFCFVRAHRMQQIVRKFFIFIIRFLWFFLYSFKNIWFLTSFDLCFYWFYKTNCTVLKIHWDALFS